MSLQSRLKVLVESLPEGVGRALSRTPFTLRLGPEYRRMRRSIVCAELQSSQDSAALFLRMRKLLERAFAEVEFYRDFYAARGFSLKDFRSLSDWERIPVVTKADMQAVALRSRCAPAARGMRINSGGTTGQPLEFLVDNRAFAREWAHMHYLWAARGYDPRQLKVTLRGKHFDTSQPLRYNAVHNEYVANSSRPMHEIVAAVLALPRTSVIRWIHGYPSLVSEFARYLAAHPAPVHARFRANLYGVLLGSEYPAPVYRSTIERELSTNIVSWYGHSEMAVLARETAAGVYESFPTYGYAEAVATEHGDAHRLVVTSLHNHVHPFIRYDTGDLIEPIATRGGSLSFRISEGRVGDFVVDRRGNRHALTSVIFGRHHEAFELLQHVQVRDDGGGCVTLLVTPRISGVSADEIFRRFDLQDLDIEWRLEVRKTPVRTAAGKIRLKVATDPSGAVSTEFGPN
ncbi:MAG: hypothetical protein IRZ28_19205 [Steroidobacteraceae bacterium]|nr:hypothetical protein [Steroidobacteraceae bacterium]